MKSHGAINVLHLASGDGWGGAERVIAELIHQARASSQVNVEALLFNEGRLSETLRDLGIPVHVIDERASSFTALVREVRRMIGARRPDVVHAHRYKEIVLASLALLPRRRGLVVTVHGLEPVSQLGWRQLPRFWGPLWIAAFMRATLVAVSGELQRRLARRLVGCPVLCIPNPMPRSIGGGVPDVHDQVGWDRTRPLVGFVGRLEPVKGPDRFIDIASRHRGNAGFVVVGAGSLESKLHAVVRERGLTDRVAFLGAVPDATGYVAQLDVLAIPSRHEGLPVVALEAAACGVPVVAFNVGGVAEVLDGGPAARLVAPDNESEFLTELEFILNSGNAIKSATARWATAVHARFDATQVWSQYQRVYRTAIAPDSLAAEARAQ